MHTVFALLCFVVVIHWLIFPYPSGLLHWHCGNLTIAPVPAKQPWWIWINTSCEFIMNDCITTTKQSTTKPCAYFWGYTVFAENAKISVGYDFSSISPFLRHQVDLIDYSYPQINAGLADIQKRFPDFSDICSVSLRHTALMGTLGIYYEILSRLCVILLCCGNKIAVRGPNYSFPFNP